MSPRKLYDELETLAEKLGYVVLTGKGNFFGGYCTIDGEMFIVLNKSKPIEHRLRIIAESLAVKDLEGLFIKPAVRDFLSDISGAG